jgi:hypothetical protein
MDDLSFISSSEADALKTATLSAISACLPAVIGPIVWAYAKTNDYDTWATFIRGIREPYSAQLANRERWQYHYQHMHGRDSISFGPRGSCHTVQFSLQHFWDFVCGEPLDDLYITHLQYDSITKLNPDNLNHIREVYRCLIGMSIRLHRLRES